MTLEGVETVERYYDNQANMYYALSVLNKEKTVSRLLSQSAANCSQAVTLSDDAGELLEKGAVLEGLRKLILSSYSFEAAKQDSKIASILGARVSACRYPETMLADTVSRIDIECISGCCQSGRIGDSLPEPIEAKVSFDKNGLLDDFPVCIEMNNEPAQDIFHTSENGIASVKSPAIKKTGKKDNTFMVVPGWDAIIKEALGKNHKDWQGNISSPGAVVRYSIRSENTTKIIISSCLDIDGKSAQETLARQMLADSLRAAGFIVSILDECITSNNIESLKGRFGSKADMIVVIDSNASKSHVSRQLVYRVNMSLVCYDLVRSEIAATMDSEAVGMANQARQAVDRALNNACEENAGLFVGKIKENLR
jgi:hypothetical protein